LVGNDIVDLCYFDSPTYNHVKHLERVCTPEEARSVRQSTDPCKTLAVIWASKEAVYKLISKQVGSCHFIPRQFETDFVHPASSCSNGKAVVNYEGVRADVEIMLTEQWVHTVATFPEPKVVRWAVREIKSWFRPGSQARAETDAARSLAAKLLSLYGSPDLTLSCSGKFPSVRRTSGEAAEMGVSLSHHGAFASAAIAWSSKYDSLHPDDRSRLAVAFCLEEMCSTSTA
jgi:phosphopantetheine--protein transferase-like protein